MIPGVKAQFYLDVHGPDITEDNVTSILKSVAANNTLGQFEVEKAEIKSKYKEVGKLNLVFNGDSGTLCTHKHKHKQAYKLVSKQTTMSLQRASIRL